MSLGSATLGGDFKIQAWLKEGTFGVGDVRIKKEGAMVIDYETTFPLFRIACEDVPPRSYDCH